MKKTFKHLLALSLLLCSVFIFSSCGEKKQPYLIPNNVVFGMQESEVVEAMGREPDSSNDFYISYDLPYNQYDLPQGTAEKYSIELWFNKLGQLSVINYPIGQEFLHEYDFDLTLQTKDNILNYLKEVYGEPSDYKEEWNSSRYKLDESNWDKALKNGDLVITAYWMIFDDESIKHDDEIVFVKMEFCNDTPSITIGNTYFSSTGF